MNKTYKAGLLGKFVKNSYSKEIYYAVFDKIDYKNYVIKKPEDLDLILTEKDFDFVNITNPYKKTVIPFLDTISKTVKETGVCNLIINKNGVLFGYNTDAYGFESLLKKQNIDISNKNILILGNGATSDTVKYVLKQKNPKSIVCGCRNIRKDEDVLFENIKSKKSFDIIINTTPVGTLKNDKELIDLKEYQNLKTFIDVIYNPYRTKAMISAKELGIGFVGGIDMLLYQAQMAHNLVVKGFYPSFIWEDLKLRIVLSHINITFIGLPTSGKTKICKELKKDLKASYIDTDEVIEKTAKKKIHKIFSQYGEEVFRDLEKEVVKAVCNVEGYFISTGGGTVINKENYKRLARRGFFVYLKKTNFDDFVNDGKRPLIKTKDDLKRLYYKRNPIYEKIADLTVSSDADISEVIMEVKNAILNS